MEEPFNRLDNQDVNEMRELFLELKRGGKVILLTRHNSENIKILCAVVYRMEVGKLARRK